MNTKTIWITDNVIHRVFHSLLMPLINLDKIIKMQMLRFWGIYNPKWKQNLQDKILTGETEEEVRLNEFHHHILMLPKLTWLMKTLCWSRFWNLSTNKFHLQMNQKLLNNLLALHVLHILEDAKKSISLTSLKILLKANKMLGKIKIRLSKTWFNSISKN